MKIEKLNFSNFAGGKVEASNSNLPPAPKNFSYFGKQNDAEEPEFTKSELSNKSVEAQKKGFEEGFNKGKEEVIQTALAIEQNTKLAVEQIAAQLTKFLAQYDEEKKNFMRNMVKVAMMAIQKISTKVIKENTEEVLLQAFEKASHVFAKQPEIRIKTKKIILEKIQDKVDNILKGQDFKGSVTYVPDESVVDGNCVIEWGTSGVSINSDESMKQIDETLSEYLKSI
jgi:flagellar biosynthesis/type III secretory pathway protein FliH